MVRSKLLRGAVFSLIAMASSPAFAQAAAANAVRDKLASLAPGALLLGVVWAGWKFWLGEGVSREQIALFIIGAAMVFGGGYFLA